GHRAGHGRRAAGRPAARAGGGGAGLYRRARHPGAPARAGAAPLHRLAPASGRGPAPLGIRRGRPAVRRPGRSPGHHQRPVADDQCRPGRGRHHLRHRGLLPAVAGTRRAGAAAAGLPAVVPRLLPVLPRPPPRPAQAARPGRPRARAAGRRRPGLSPAPGPNLRHPPLIPLATMLGGALVRATRMEIALKKTLLTAATLVALGLAANASAHDAHACVDSACTMQLLYAADDAAGSGTIPAARLGAWGFDTAGMDTSAKPGEDFFAYASGNWAKNPPIPADQSSYGNSRVLRDLSEARLHKLVEGYPLADPATGG